MRWTVPPQAKNAVAKTLFLDLVKILTVNGMTAGNIPAKIEGGAFGPDVQNGSTTLHTLWVANDNDFLSTVPDANGNPIANPNQFFVFGFSDADLGGSNSYRSSSATPPPRCNKYVA